MSTNPSNFKKGNNYPVEQMSWNDVQEFIRRLNRRSSARFRLPSEAQWEYACRAGGKRVNYGTRSGRMKHGSAKYGSREGAVPVGKYPANSLGLHDMSGNVWEWVQDKFTGYGNVGPNNPIFEGSGSNRVMRGGSWFNGSRGLRCSIRIRVNPWDRSEDLGFRLVRVR